MNLKQNINSITRDEFGRPSGILALNKDDKMTAHDLVDIVRKKLHTRKVGHAGALDSFATGLMLILVGKATKKSNTLINLNKTYEARILLGVSTETQDIEGKVTEIDANYVFDETEVKKILDSFEGEQMQTVSLYSSVKVDGNKLRVLMRDEKYNKQIELLDGNKKVVHFEAKDPSSRSFSVEIPQKNITIFEIEMLNSGKLVPAEYINEEDNRQSLSNEFPFIDVRVRSSKGTYIRQLAEDIGRSLGTVAMLVELKRTGIEDLTLADTITIDSLE